MEVVINESYNHAFPSKVIEWFKEHDIELPEDTDESFFKRHDPMLVKCVKELHNLLDYLKIVNIKGSIYRINYDFENCCEYVEEPQEEMGWICGKDDSNLVVEKHINECSRHMIESKEVCPYCLDDNDKETTPFNPKWCEHCSNYSNSFLKIREFDSTGLEKVLQLQEQNEIPSPKDIKNTE